MDKHFGASREPAAEAEDFTAAARRRWLELGEELKADVAEFNSRRGGADLSQPTPEQYLIANSSTGIQLVITADFDARTVRYDFARTNDQSAGTPEGGMLSMRRSRTRGVEFYSADERLTSEETRKVLLEPVLFPPEMAA